MKKAKEDEARPKSIDMISGLPKEILHKILYSVSQKDAVRTSVLSKSWRNIWSTRTNLDLDFSHPNFTRSKQEFLTVVDKTLQLYRDQRLCLEEFHLSVSLLGDYYSDRESVSLLDKWIPLLTSMGVKEFRLSILSNEFVDLSSVVFKAESLVFFCLKKCKLGEKIPENIPFGSLQVLRLENIFFENEIVFEKIISSCPLLTTMWFHECRGLKTIKLENKLHKYLKHFTFIGCYTYVNNKLMVEIDAPTIETIKIFGSKIRFGEHHFRNLKSLSINWWLSSCTDSIELCIDAPNINHFEYNGNFIPSISFAPTSNEWRSSHVRFYIQDVQDARLWFVELSKLLQALSPSEISLDFVQFTHYRIAHDREDVLVHDIFDCSGNGPVAVEHLELSSVDLSASLYFLNGLFRICCPRKITQHLLMRGGSWNEKQLIEYFRYIRERRDYGETLRDLEDLSIECFDTSRQQWQPVQMATLLVSELRNISRIRYRLKWSDSSFRKIPTFYI
ncbi:hypothetical protein ABFS82_05G050700 [Erythranthe guttata]|uniref:putative F-box/LRR-repeat protein At3g44810 n=1 Tax=Erythranthe guttata TaxID=4155 RepID=UPI00064DDE9F|nr:PREDICTED: putative F-box/LRR-repeat protein At3g44810 [Erythranthe guttata]|eukprot:XP_012846257.1 PREDICTED: putative F-box/LRR-repeat protein At3g44810 [Erythranthe guttata]